MKKILISALFSLVFCTLSAQSSKRTDWIYQSDILIGNEILRLGVKELYLNKTLTYRFFLSLTDTAKTADILADDFKQGDYLNTLLFKKLLAIYDSLEVPGSISTSDTELISVITTAIKNNSGALNDSNKSLITNILDKTSINPRQHSIEGIFNALKAELNGEGKNWLNQQLLDAKSKIKARHEDVQKNLEQNCRIFLTGVFVELQKRATDAPKVGLLFTKKEILIRHDSIKKPTDCTYGIEYTDKTRGENQPENMLKSKGQKDELLDLEQLEIKFEAGQIVSLKANGYIDCLGAQEIVFQNRLPISYSTKFDVSQDFHIGGDRRIYCVNRELNGCFLLLSDLLYNDYKLSNYTENYSPIDTVITLKPQEAGRVIFRERVNDILQARIYTDVLGFSNEHPNGLVQAEFSKKINLKTSARPLYSSETTINYQLLRYVIPYVSFTKLEKNQKFLPVSIVLKPGESDSARIGIGTKDLQRNANFAAGGQLNLYTFSLPKYHSTFNFDFGWGVMLTGIASNIEEVDTSGQSFFQLTNNRNVASSVFSPLIFTWNIHPHTHYHVSFHYKSQFISLLDTRFYQLDKEPVKKGAQFMHQFGMVGGLKANDDSRGEVFFRVLWNLNARYKSQNYVQAQIGYTFKVFSQKVAVKSKPVFSYP